MNRPKSELERVSRVYAARNASGRYSLFDLAHRRMLHEVEGAALDLLAKRGMTELGGCRVLDVGCGRGFWLRRMLDWGIEPHDLHGLDALPDRIADAIERLPEKATVIDGDAAALPWASATFDLVTQFVVFSSILDPAIRAAVAQEMLRVLKPGGAVLWYDFHRDNPNNPDVEGIGRQEIRRLFGGCRVELRPVTLAPPLARWLAARAGWSLGLVGGIRLLKTHTVGVITP